METDLTTRYDESKRTRQVRIDLRLTEDEHRMLKAIQAKLILAREERVTITETIVTCIAESLKSRFRGDE